jgi:hypothetical protein
MKHIRRQVLGRRLDLPEGIEVLDRRTEALRERLLQVPELARPARQVDPVEGLVGGAGGLVEVDRLLDLGADVLGDGREDRLTLSGLTPLTSSPRFTRSDISALRLSSFWMASVY